MLQWNIYKIFKDLPNVFGIVDDILIVVYNIDSRDHGKALKSNADVPARTF